METFRLGIDFGTTYSCVGVWKDGGIVIIPNMLGERTTPSVVLFESPERAYVGEETTNRLPKKESFKIYEIKRLIGKKYYEVKDLIQYFSFKVVKQKDGDRPVVQITFDEEKTIEYTPEFIASLIIRKLIMNAIYYLKKSVNEVIITVPADFNDCQRNGIIYAAQSIEGIKVIQLLNEPCAAVLSYRFPTDLLKNWLFPFNQNYTLIKDDKSDLNHPMEEIFGNNNDFNTNNKNLLNFSLKASLMDQEKTIIVFDLGGGTYDVSLIQVNDYLFETRSTSGNQRLGGGDLDNKLMEYCLDEFIRQDKTKKINKDEIKNNYKCMQRLKIACERSKIILSIKDKDNVTVYIEDFYKDLTLNCLITRAKFEYLCKDFFDKLIPPIDSVLNNINLKEENIDEILLVGGSSRIPKIKDILKEKFPNSIINDSINPDEAVAFGATIYAESLIRNTGEFWEDFEYLDSTRSSLGIEVEDGTMDVIIKKGSNYPTNVTRYYFNAYDDQYTIDIKVYEGENKFAKDNDLLAEFTLTDFPKKKKNELCIAVTFDIDDNQILKVTAFIAEGNVNRTITVHKKDIYSNENLPLKLGNISIIGDDLSKEEKKLKLEIFSYSKQFKNLTTDNDKYKLIQNYNMSVISYLKFLEVKCEDVNSEKFLFLVENLFKSYSYFYKTQLNALVPLNEKINIKKNIELYLSKIYRSNPYRIKHLLAIFKDIKLEKSDIFYSSSLYSMKEIKKLADEYLEKQNENSILISNSLYEECLIIGKLSFEVGNALVLLDLNLFREYNEIKEECEDKIKINSVNSFYIITITKQKGTLFSNDKNLDYDNLCLLSFKLLEYLNKLNAINDLNENKEAYEMKSICLANIVKVEFLKNKQDSLDIKLLKQLSQQCKDSIKIANELGNICTNKEWYKEIVDLEKTINKKLSGYNPAPSIEDINKIELELKQNFDLGIENFLRFLLTKYPYEGCAFSEEMIEEFNNNKRNFLRNLYKKYNKNGNSIMQEANANEIGISSQKKSIIKKYINNCINSLPP